MTDDIEAFLTDIRADAVFAAANARELAGFEQAVAALHRIYAEAADDAKMRELYDEVRGIAAQNDWTLERRWFAIVGMMQRRQGGPQGGV